MRSTGPKAKALTPACEKSAQVTERPTGVVCHRKPMVKVSCVHSLPLRVIERKEEWNTQKSFIKSLEKIVDKRPHKCKSCGVVDGEKEYNKDGVTRKKFPAIVRLALIDVNGPANRADNVGMYCTRCRKPPAMWRTPRKIKPSSLAQLF